MIFPKFKRDCLEDNGAEPDKFKQFFLVHIFDKWTLQGLSFKI